MRSGGLSWCLALAVVFTVPGCGSWDGVRTEVIDGVNRLVHRDYPRALQERDLESFVALHAPERAAAARETAAQLLDGFATVKEAQDHTLSKIKPGVPCRDIAAAHDAFMAARGIGPEKRLYAHGQGYDLVERPLIREDETMSIEAGMNLAVHPGYETSSQWAVICDNYLVEADGPSACLHRTPKQIFEL